MKSFIMTVIAVVFLFGTLNVSVVEPREREDISQMSSRMKRTHPGHLSNYAVKISKEIDTTDILGRHGMYYSSGSGSVIGVAKDRSLVLTVYHVCRESYTPGSVLNGKLVVEEKHFVITKAGDKLKINGIVYEDKDNDICVVDVAGVAGSSALISKNIPKTGDRIYIVGAPKGIWDKGVAHIIEGLFVGIKDKPINGKFKNFAQYSAHAAPGSSGSAIFYRGKIIGLLSHGNRSYSNVAYGPSLDVVSKTFNKSIKKWRSSL